MKRIVLLGSTLIVSIAILVVFLLVRIKNNKEKPTILHNNAIRENTLIDLVTNEEIIEDTKENKKENTKENKKEITNTNEETKVETQKKNEANSKKSEVINNEKFDDSEIVVAYENKNNTENNDTPEQETEIIEKQTIDLSKYDRYENGLNGGYKCFKKNPSEIAKLKSLLDNSISEFGYVDVSLMETDTITNARSFTANKTNVDNVVHNSEGFKIYYYAETEYTVNAEGIETEFQTRAYLKVVEK